ncbi:MAG: beta-lactamase family protein [Clostridiales Family XIII bacterium]|jgi:CubicO group peptidase (beta-lactamase class C family)|nr:beta-lactamase family protein [Clostridiales Family XIII bacterium]
MNEHNRQDKKNAVVAMIDKVWELNDLPGLAVGVSGNGIDALEVRGYSDYIQKTPLRTDHVFHFCSVSKLFVATAIMQLVEQDRLSLDDNLPALLPWFVPEDARYRRVTVRAALSHTAGIPDVSDYAWDRPETDTEALRRYVSSDEVCRTPLLHGPGEAVYLVETDESKEPERSAFCYSNIGFEMLGAVIAERSGMPFEEYVRMHILDILGMSDSTFLTFLRPQERLAQPHEKEEDRDIARLRHYPYNRAHAPSSTLGSTLSDIRKFGDAFLGRNPALLSEASYDLLWQRTATVPNNGEGMGLTWFIRNQNGFALYGHEGTDDGFRSSFWLCPELSLQITVLSNLTGAKVKKICRQIFDAVTK